MAGKTVKSFFIILTVMLCASAYATDWVQIKGNVTTEGGTSLCAMVLANGQYMFTCESIGIYNLDVPLDSNGQITLFAFCDGLMPFKTILNRWQNQFDISMSPCLCENPNPESCENIKGNWSDYAVGVMTMTMLGETKTDSFMGNRTVSVGQTGCNTEWNFTDSGTHYERTGAVEGNIVTLSGDMTNSASLADELEDGLKDEGMNVSVTFLTNTHNGDGTISGDRITYEGSGYLSGTLTYMGVPFDISVSLNENSTLTRTGSRSSADGLVNGTSFPMHSLKDVLIEAIRQELSD